VEDNLKNKGDATLKDLKELEGGIKSRGKNNKKV
jgi:hypothetical protein